MKTMKYFFMAALALLMTAACSSNDDELAQQPVEQPANNMITITAQLAPKSSNAKTRAVSESGGNIVVDWVVDEHLAILYEVNSTKYAANARVTAVDGSGNATIEFTVESGTTDGTACQIVYPLSAAKDDHSGVKNNATLLTAQDGTLSANLDVRVGAGTIQTSTPSLNVTTEPAAQFAIWKLTLGSAAKNLCILADNETIAGATLASAGTEFYVAVPAVSSKTVTVVANDESNNCYYYSKAGVSLTAGNYYQSTPSMTALGTDRTASVYKITGTSGDPIPNGKTVVFSGVNISSGITCNGDATIILMGSNTITAPSNNAAIQAGGSGTTLTITGTGSLTATGGQCGAGIGGIKDATCGNITISGGTVTATGGERGAGIGSSKKDENNATCGTITISGGTVTATGGYDAAGIGSGDGGTCGNITISGGTVTANGGKWGAGIGGGNSGICGNITINNTVTRVTATKQSSGSPQCIGAGDGGSTCGTVTIGGVVGAITTSPYTYTPAPAPAPAPAWNANEYNEGSWNSTLEKVEFTKQTAATTPTALTDVTENVSWSDGWYTVSGDVTINGNVTLGANTYLILQDDAELTINGYVWGTGNHYSLFIYGQEKGNGKLIVNASKNGLVYGFTDFEIHGGENTFENTNTSTGFALSSTNFKMYGGKLTATAAAGNAIQYNNTDIYGGEVVATATGDYHFGMKNNNSSSLLTVYGGKLTAGNTDYNNKAISGNVKSGVSTIQFYGSADGNTWSATGQSFDAAAEIDYTTGIFNDVKYVKAE